MWNRFMALKVVLGMVLITITIFPANAQVAKLTEIVAAVPDPISPIIVYPPPPGIKHTSPSTEVSAPTTSNKQSALDHGTKFSPSLSQPSIPPKLNTISSDVPNDVPMIQFKTDEAAAHSVVEVTTKSFLTTKGIEEVMQKKEESTTVFVPQATTEIPFKIDESNTSTENPFPANNTTTPKALIETTTSFAIPKEKQCTTPIGKNGECKDIRRCSSLLGLLMREPLLVENKLYLQRSQCGLENQTVLVCCPDNVPPPLISPKLSLLPRPPACGIMTENRIYGGYHTEIDSFKWMALLEYSKGENSTSAFHCGGALINDRYVLTAAHCVKDLPKSMSLKSVRLGEWNLATEMDCSDQGGFLDCTDPVVNVAVEEIIPHNDFSTTSRTSLHDIALIRLATPINRTDFIEPICLPFGENTLHAFDEQALDMVGWGATPKGLFSNFKQRTNAYVIPLDKCRLKYAEKNITIEQTQFCVEGRIIDDMCRIDSGGPLISFDTSDRGLGRYYIAGVQSFQASSCSVPDVPGVYTRVADYLDWILENIRA